MAGTTVTDDGAVEEAFRVALAAGGIDPSSPDGEVASAYIRDTMGQSKIDVFKALFKGDTALAEAANKSFEESYAPQHRRRARSVRSPAPSRRSGAFATTGSRSA